MCTIYTVVIPHLALRHYVALHQISQSAVSLRNTPRGERVDMGWFTVSKKFRNLKIRSTLYIYDARYRHFTPPTDPARRNIGSPVYLSDLSIRLSVYLSPFLLFTSQREFPRAYTETYVGDIVDFSLSPSSSLCPVARKYFLGSPLIYHNRRLSTRSKLLNAGTITPFVRDRARPQSTTPLILPLIISLR